MDQKGDFVDSKVPVSMAAKIQIFNFITAISKHCGKQG